MADLLAPRKPVRFGCWNVRTLYQVGKLAQVVNEFNKYRLCFMGMSEVRWSGSGQQRLNGGETIIWSGRQDDLHYEGVALLICKERSNAVLQWKPVNERLLYVRMNSKFSRLSIVVVYAPTEDAPEEEKDRFYEAMQSTLLAIPRHDVLLVLGDFNARTGNDNTNHKRTMGIHGTGELNDNGERLIDFCEENDLVIGGTLFPHKDIHKLTWTSPDGQTRCQLDHILINGKWRRSLQDVRVMRNADVGSDHSLLIGKLQLKLRNAKVGKKCHPRLDVVKLNDPNIRELFSVAIREKLKSIQTESSFTMSSFNHALKEVGEKVLGHRRKSKVEWISPTTWQLVAERKHIKTKLLSTKNPEQQSALASAYRAKDKEVKKAARKDKRDYFDRLAEQAEEAARMNDMKNLYQISRKLAGKRHQVADYPVRACDGELVTETKAKLDRWKEHFQSILNRPLPQSEVDIPEADEDLDVNLKRISVQEVQQAIHQMKNGKSPGEDGVYAEMLKAEGEEIPNALCGIFQEIWETERIPPEWREGTIIKLPKKGDLSYCTNWRGITLLSVTCKIFGRIILRRISGAVDSVLRQEQAGFRKGKSCVDQIFTLRQILEQVNEWNASLCVAYIDFEKAFDSVHRPMLWKILRHYGVPVKIVNLIASLYENFECRVAHDGLITEKFAVQTGVRQGCILSPLLFSLAMDWTMRQVTHNNPHGIPWTPTAPLEDLDYADDLALLASNVEDIQSKTERLLAAGSAVGLTINVDKSYLMRKNIPVQSPVLVNGQPLSEVEETTYLGSKVTTDGDCEKDIRSRIGKANQAFCMLSSVWNSSRFSITTKLRLFKSNVLSVLLYASECWKSTASIERRLNVFQNKCLRRILKVFWPVTITNEELLRRTGMEPAAITLRRRRWRWFGHVCRMDPSAHARVAIQWQPQGKRKRGRPKETWRRTIIRELKINGFTLQTAMNAAADRNNWRTLVNASCATGHEED